MTKRRTFSAFKALGRELIKDGDANGIFRKISLVFRPQGMAKTIFKGERPAR